MQDDHKTKKFRTEIGVSATVQRSTEASDEGRMSNAALRNIGQALNPLPASLKHMGSAAFHVYYNETLKQAFFVSQAGSTLEGCPEALAQAGTKDFIGTVMETYGQRRPKLRSGF